ncbi:uncharacterized protein LOC136024896 isoform X1 [Artemia franciscana]|uniref:uncharacterized protein LOC136024896 isoform X1 n=1 Tax=Artemia franciscana TaxID=6661 RepID=UPI0032DB8912
MDSLKTETDEPLEDGNFAYSSNDLDAPKGNSCSMSQILVSSFTLKEEEITDPLQIKNDEPMKVSNFFHSFYGLDTPSWNSFQALAGCFTLNEEEIVDPLQIENDEAMKVSNLSHSFYGLDNSKNNSCNTSQALVGPLTLKEEGSIHNGCSRKKCGGLVRNLSSTGELIWLSNVSNNSKIHEKMYLKTTVEIEKLTKRTIEENCCGKWRCSACGKIENTFYFSQLHKSTNCETGLSFICEICLKEINNYSDFAIHYIEHEADKEKKCPICLCPNVNDIKEHVIMENHLSVDVTGLKFTANKYKRSNEKARLEVILNSNIDGYCQDTTADMLTSVEAQSKGVSSASASVDTVKISSVFNHLILGNQKQEDQGKTDLILSKPYRTNDISDEEQIPSFNSSPGPSKKKIVCKVCGDKASGFHYGVTTCEACKIFFRRITLRQTEYTEADCIREGKCFVSWVNKSECQFCRFKKCLAAGMSRDCK